MIPAIAKIFEFEQGLRALPQIDLPLQHFVIPGAYVRVMEIPAGSALTGKIHNRECVSIVAKGRIVVTDGDKPVELSAGWVGVSPPGIKRAGYALEDTIFITVHKAETSDIAELENRLVSETVGQYQELLT